jgi:hypothetical protein
MSGVAVCALLGWTVSRVLMVMSACRGPNAADCTRRAKRWRLSWMKFGAGSVHSTG